MRFCTWGSTNHMLSTKFSLSSAIHLDIKSLLKSTTRDGVYQHSSAPQCRSIDYHDIHDNPAMWSSSNKAMQNPKLIRKIKGNVKAASQMFPSAISLLCTVSWEVIRNTKQGRACWKSLVYHVWVARSHVILFPLELTVSRFLILLGKIISFAL